MIIDTHCHLNFNLFQDDLPEVLSRARDCGVGRIVVPATDLASSHQAIELSHKYPEVYAAVGIHPNDCDRFTIADVDKLQELALDPQVVAIGEIGLDKYHDDVDLPVQQTAFEAQLDLALSLNLPVLLHNREADEEMKSTLQRWYDGKTNSRTGILHAFSSPIEFAWFAINLGFYLGFGGPITYKNSGSKKEIISEIRRDRVVLETDAPFLSPQTKRGKRNEPSFTVFIAEEVANIWKTSFTEVAEITTQNAARIFQWNNLM
ncbi:MAG: TatD family hydrolase [Chloroflexi bacterium]|nr:TatD family hydrolase [Chloroflexota bacterium]